MKVSTLLKWYTLVMWFILVAMILGSCRQLSKGKVVDKDFQPAYYNIINKHPHYNPPVYRVKVEGSTKNWEITTEWWRVSSGNYERLKIGDNVDSTIIKYW